MCTILVFTDGSVNTKTKIGYGAYLALNSENLSIEELKKQVRLKRFENTSSTKLELQTMLWALHDIEFANCKIELYTDSQNIISLQERRGKLERNNYTTGKGTRLKNTELYKDFFSLTDKLNCSLVKLKGHKKSKLKDRLDMYFSLVDKASRRALRKSND